MQCLSCLIHLTSWVSGLRGSSFTAYFRLLSLQQIRHATKTSYQSPSSRISYPTYESLSTSEHQVSKVAQLSLSRLMATKTPQSKSDSHAILPLNHALRIGAKAPVAHHLAPPHSCTLQLIFASCYRAVLSDRWALGTIPMARSSAICTYCFFWNCGEVLT